MEKERIDLFGEEQKKLTDGRSRTTAVRVSRAGLAFFSTIALGVALFAVVFIICCFAGGFGAPEDGQQDKDTTSEYKGTDTINPNESTVPGAKDNNNDKTPFDERGFLAFLKNFFNSWGNKDPGVDTTDGTSDTQTEPTVPVYENIDELYNFDYSLVPPGEAPIVPMDMSLISYGEAYIYNETKYAPKISALLNSKDAIPAFDFLNAAVYPIGEPVVLIIHTHGTEAYSGEGDISYLETSGSLARSDDIERNVVAVGKVIAGVLSEKGIKTLHCTIMHDLESYKDSYIRSAATINEYLSKNPSIQYVIDIHRDSLTTSTGSIIRPVILAEGKATAQVMCVVGSDYNGASYAGWQNNLSLALKLRHILNKEYDNLCRPVYLRGSAYNQQYSPMSILLEVGASGNSLSEAKEAARLVGLALSDLIKGKAG